jgi:hypothetical protein
MYIMHSCENSALCANQLTSMQLLQTLQCEQRGGL